MQEEKDSSESIGYHAYEVVLTASHMRLQKIVARADGPHLGLYSQNHWLLMVRVALIPCSFHSGTELSEGISTIFGQNGAAGCLLFVRA